MRHHTIVLAVLAISLPAGCTFKTAPASWTATASCLSTDGATDGAAVRWISPDDPDDVARLEPWCRAVGPAYVSGPKEARTTSPADSVAVVTWNVHLDGGEARRLIGDLRSGRLTGGKPVRHFVLLLQEAVRRGPAVPSSPPAWSASADRIDAMHSPGPSRDVARLAADEGLYLFYAPSMRNGAPDDGGSPEDRGNAILSTLPLAKPTAVELPFERQRRVALVASVKGRRSDGSPWALRFVDVHLDNRAAFARLYRSFGAAQSSQVRGLLDALDDALPTVVGGDLNTWYRSEDAGPVRLLQARFASLRHPPGERTARIPLLPDLRLDHLFFGVPETWSKRYRVLADSYGSDHRPLLGWVGFGPAGRSVLTDLDEAKD